MLGPGALKAALKARAHELGFDLVGITTVQPPAHLDHYQAWIAAGRHAGMGYLAGERALQRRSDPRTILPGCRSIIVTGTYYAPLETRQSRSTSDARVAAYAQGDDYHTLLAARLQDLAGFLRAECGHEFEHRIYTDTGPLLERELAMRAGLGWIGKNTCLIHPSRGSYLLLAEMLLDLELPPDEPFASDRCGSCTRCIEACPTGCILPDRTLDAGRCISYLTIEEKSSIPAGLRPAIGDWLFGCDICQDVCPWNQRFACTVHDRAFQPRPVLTPLRLAGMLERKTGAWRDGLRGSPLERPRRRGLVRNAAVVAGNQRRSDLTGVLGELLRSDPEPIVREHAAWALGQLEPPDARAALQHALQDEAHPGVRAAIQEALDQGSR